MKRRSCRSLVVRVGLLYSVRIFGVLPLAAQTPVASAYVPVDHWSRAALARLAAEGSIDSGVRTAAWPLPVARVAALFVDAEARNARSNISAMRNHARDARQAFAREFGDSLDGSKYGWHARIANGWTDRRGLMRAGTSTWVPESGWHYPGPNPIDDESSWYADATVSGSLTQRVSVSGSAHVARDHIAAREIYGTAAFGRADVWAGRRAYDLGGLQGDGLVLSEGSIFGGGGVQVSDPFYLPGFMHALGGIRASAMLARMNRSGEDLHPLFMAMNVSMQPARRLAIGINRAALFGGSGNSVNTTPWTVLLMVVGITDTGGKDSDFENQVASINAQLQTHVRAVPVTWYGEFGTDDSGYAFLHVPAWIAGVSVPALPFASALGVSVEHVHVPGRCCTYPSWYQHGALADGWTDRGRLFGVPLGGEGREWNVRWQLDTSEGRVRARGRAFTRLRGDENLFAPARGGRSRGADVNAMVEVSGRLRVVTGFAIERGHGWTSGSGRIGTEVIF